MKKSFSWHQSKTGAGSPLNEVVTSVTWHLLVLYSGTSHYFFSLAGS